MKRSLRIALGFVPAMIAALVFWTPAAAPVGLQNVNLACNDGTNLALALDFNALAQLTDAVNAINLYPAGDPALACSLTQSTGLSVTTSVSDSASGNGPQDHVVGGGQAALLGCPQTNFSVSAHGPADSGTANPPGTGTPTSGGTFNLTTPSSVCTAGHIVAKPDCLQVGAWGPGTAQLTAVVTHATGAFAGAVGLELEVDLFDSGLPGGTGDQIGLFSGFPPCSFDGFAPYATVDRGNINVRDA